jgi:4-amino-4-deoxy-L-arabinose transferase-like glycosyltransferase
MKIFFILNKKETISLGLILVLALGARLSYVTGIDSPPFSDMAHYDQLARSILDGEGFQSDGRVTAYRPPGYPVFIAGIYLLSGHSPGAVRIVQAFLGALSCGLGFFLCRTWLGKTEIGRYPVIGLTCASLGALVAALVLAFYDEWIFYSGQLLSEIPYTFLLLLWLLHFTFLTGKNIDPEKKDDYHLILLGLLAGVISLFRPVGLFTILPAVIVLLFYRWRRQKSRIDSGIKKPLKQVSIHALMILAGWLFICSPWIARNMMHFGPGAGLSTNTGVNFYIGHNENFGYWSTGAKNTIREMTTLDEAGESRLFLHLGLDYISKHPGQTLVNSGKKLIFLFIEPWRPWPLHEDQSLLDAVNPWSKRHIGPYKPWPWYGHGRELPPQNRAYPFPLLPWDLPALGLVSAGLILAVCKRAPWIPLYVVFGGHILSCLVFFARARFRMPLGILFSLLAAYALMFLLVKIMKIKYPPGTASS